MPSNDLIHREAQELASRLQKTVQGEVRFDDGSRALYSTDASNYRQVPIGVVIPRELDEVRATVELCRSFGAPILPRGGGTSLAGQCCNVAVVIDFSKYLNQIIEIDSDNRLARVQPGVVCDTLRNAAEKHGLTFGPDPSTHRWCTIGGMIGNNSCGVHSVAWGKTAENLHSLEILTYDGLRAHVGQAAQMTLTNARLRNILDELHSIRDEYGDLIRSRYPNIPRRVSGYNLNQLLPENNFNVARALVGSEGTCVTILEATVNLVPRPPCRSLLVLGFPDVYQAADHVPELLLFQPTGLEGIDEVLVEDMKKKHLHPADVAQLPEGRGWLLMEFDGESQTHASDRAHRAMQQITRSRNATINGRVIDEPALQDKMWEVRESGLGATALVPGESDTWEGWEDSAAPPERLGEYLRDLRKLFARYGYHGALYGHFGDGCVHTRINFDLFTKDGIGKFRSFLEEAADLVLSYGGSLSGEHGDGQSRGWLLRKMFGDELVEAFRRFKRVWDPDWKMNPGKVVDPYPVDANLRFGTHYAPRKVTTHFRFPNDHGDFARATARCVGVGECRRTDGGTMCPSYMVTREEMHTTRGRAHLLFEMMNGRVIGQSGWRDEHVKEALDLCLSCKGCLGDCPVNVDVATYKAEFLAHYYQARLRPRSAYAFGLIYWIARLASLAPALVNLVTQTPLLRDAVKFLAGMAPERSIPAFAPQTFRRWFQSRRTSAPADNKPILLWPDTFTNFFHPEVGRAAVDVLEHLGFYATIPPRSLCCGRPLYDYGMLPLAKSLLRQSMETLRPQLESGTPIVVLEPSCAAVFRDELINLFPADPDARRLQKQVVLLSEFFAQNEQARINLPKLSRKALIHTHCHHRAVMGIDDQVNILTKLGLDINALDSGCCGMAGSFGFEAGERYSISIGSGERVMLPAVRSAEPETIICADGFSCREQIAQSTNRRALHLAQVIQLALREKMTDTLPESAYVAEIRREQTRLRRRALAVAGLALLIGGAWLLRRRSNGARQQATPLARKHHFSLY
jgi:FAD/FMN-containing dehydrogenase/Fe-S oxidoreductase